MGEVWPEPMTICVTDQATDEEVRAAAISFPDARLVYVDPPPRRPLRGRLIAWMFAKSCPRCHRGTPRAANFCPTCGWLMVPHLRVREWLREQKALAECRGELVRTLTGANR